MSGNIAGRQRKWPWAFLSFLFAMTFAFAVSQVGGVWSIVRIGSAVGLGISVLVLVIRVISSRRLRHAEENVAGAEGDEVAETEPDAEEGPRTYEEVFGLQPHLDTDGLPPAPEDEEAWAGNEVEETGIDAEETGVDAEAFEASEAEASEVEGSEAEVETLEADGGLQDDLQRMREEFRARAEQAALRVKQREAEPQDAEPQEDDLKEAELQEAASVADQER
jgi:hypothetical protein